MDQRAKRKKTLPLRFKDLKIDNKIEIANNIDKSEKINDNLKPEVTNWTKRKKQLPAKFCDPKQIAKKSKVKASVIAKSDQESIDQPNRKSTNKLQDVKSIVCTNEIKLHKTVHEGETRKFQCEPEQIAKKAKVPKNQNFMHIANVSS